MYLYDLELDLKFTIFVILAAIWFSQLKVNIGYYSLHIKEDAMWVYVFVVCCAPLQLWCVNWWRSCRILLRGSRQWCSSPVSPAGRRSLPGTEQTHDSWSSLRIPRWKWRSARSLCQKSARVSWIRPHTHLWHFHSMSDTSEKKYPHWPLEVEPEVSEDGSTGQEGAAHAGEQVPVCSIGWAVRLRHVIGLLDHLTIYLKTWRRFKCVKSPQTHLWCFQTHTTSPWPLTFYHWNPFSSSLSPSDDS